MLGRRAHRSYLGAHGASADLFHEATVLDRKQMNSVHFVSVPILSYSASAEVLQRLHQFATPIN